MNSYVLITGATGGLGKAFAMECAERGWNVLLTDLEESRLEKLKAGIEGLFNIRVVYKGCDLTNDVSRQDLWRFIEEQDLTFHSLINVAGLDYEGPLNERTIEELDAIIRLNINGTTVMTNRIMKYRNPVKTFRIINVSSLAAYFPMPIKATYAASKRFILDFSRAIGEELRPDNVSVTVLCPGGMPSREDVIASIESQGLIGRLTTKNVGWIAYKTIESALRGKKVYIPGFFNDFLRAAGWFIPSSLLTRIIARRWHAARKKIAVDSLGV